jgi:hypothetical protein
MRSDSDGTAPTTRWERWAPASGAVSVILMVIAFLVSGVSSPDSGDSETKIASYLSSDSHQNRNFAAFFIFVAGVLFMLVFFSVLRSRLAAAEGPGGQLAQLAFGSGVASAALWIGTVSFFVAPLAVASDRGTLKDPGGIYALSNDGGYLLWVGAVVLGALVVWATSAVVLKTGMLPRWFGWVGVVVGVICLFAIFFVPAFVYWAWILVGSLLLLRPQARASMSPRSPA